MDTWKHLLMGHTQQAVALKLATTTTAGFTASEEKHQSITNYGSRSILCIGSEPFFIRRLSMDLSLVIGGIVMIFLISLEETTLQGSKVFSQLHSFVFVQKLKKRTPQVLTQVSSCCTGHFEPAFNRLSVSISTKMTHTGWLTFLFVAEVLRSS